MFDVSASLIRYWESEFKQLHPGKNSRGDRKYTKKDIQDLETIYILVKVKGFTIEGAKKALDAQKDDLLTQGTLLDTLLNIKGKLISLRNNL